jgi:L-asparaginase II
MATILAEVRRGKMVESTHTGAVAVADVTGAIVAKAGDIDRLAYFRSSAKPFQSIPLVETGAAEAFDFTDKELALACASHDATPAHQRVVQRMLTRIGLDEDALQCGVAAPSDQQEAARVTLGLKAPSQLQCECSGEHAGMLAVCCHLGYPIDEYVASDHPLQQRIRAIVARVLRLAEDELILATDGCRIPTFGAPLRTFAVAYATLAAPARAPHTAEGELAPSLDRLRTAMTAHPAMVGGEQVLDSDIMRLSQGGIAAKLGAEGLLCLAVPERGLGLAIKCEDGSPRGLGPAAIAVLEQLDLADGKMLADLRERHGGSVKTFGGERVGEVRPAFQLQRL